MLSYTLSPKNSKIEILFCQTLQPECTALLPSTVQSEDAAGLERFLSNHVLTKKARFFGSPLSRFWEAMHAGALGAGALQADAREEAQHSAALTGRVRADKARGELTVEAVPPEAVELLHGWHQKGESLAGARLGSAQEVAPGQPTDTASSFP